MKVAAERARAGQGLADWAGCGGAEAAAPPKPELASHRGLRWRTQRGDVGRRHRAQEDAAALRGARCALRN